MSLILGNKCEGCGIGCGSVSTHTTSMCAIHDFVCRFEKLISGKYLGAITHAALLKLTRDKALFGGECSERFGKLVIDRFDSKFLSFIEGDK